MLPLRRTFSQLVILGILIFYPTIANSTENTTAILISLQKVKLNNKNNPVHHTLSKLWGSYTLVEAKTGKKTIIDNRHYVNNISVEAGIYCLVSYGSQPIINPACFEAYEDMITSTGTWTIGYRMESHAEFSAIVSIHDNFSDQAAESEITNYRPTSFLNYDEVMKAFSKKTNNE